MKFILIFIITGFLTSCGDLEPSKKEPITNICNEWHEGALYKHKTIKDTVIMIYPERRNWGLFRLKNYDEKYLYRSELTLLKCEHQ